MNSIPKSTCNDNCEREKREEMIGILLAISVVSKRLAGRLSSLGDHTKDGKEKRCGET